MKYLFSIIGILTLAACLIGAVALDYDGHTWLQVLTAGAIGLGMVKQVKDATFIETFALSNGAGTTAQATGFDLENSASGDFGARAELLIEGPALTTAQLPDADTMTYAVYHDTASDFSTEALLADAVLVQTGAGGAGAAADSVRVALPDAVSRYVRVKATNSGIGNASTVNATCSLVF